jgi:hypothetical protein
MNAGMTPREGFLEQPSQAPAWCQSVGFADPDAVQLTRRSCRKSRLILIASSGGRSVVSCST